MCDPPIWNIMLIGMNGINLTSANENCTVEKVYLGVLMMIRVYFHLRKWFVSRKARAVLNFKNRQWGSITRGVNVEIWTFDWFMACLIRQVQEFCDGFTRFWHQIVSSISDGYIDVGDFMCVTIVGCCCRNFDIGDIFWMFVPDANKRLNDPIDHWQNSSNRKWDSTTFYELRNNLDHQKIKSFLGLPELGLILLNSEKKMLPRKNFRFTPNFKTDKII